MFALSSTSSLNWTPLAIHDAVNDALSWSAGGLDLFLPPTGPLSAAPGCGGGGKSVHVQESSKHNSPKILQLQK